MIFWYLYYMFVYVSMCLSMYVYTAGENWKSCQLKIANTWPAQRYWQFNTQYTRVQKSGHMGILCTHFTTFALSHF